jgi:hypothetical protein
MKSLILSSRDSTSISIFVADRRDNLFAAICFFFDTCLTSKLKSLIHAIHLVSNALDKSIATSFSWAIKTSAFVFSTKYTSYNQKRIFLRVLSILRHSRLVASYFIFAFDYISLSYLIECRLLAIIYISTSSHSLRLAFIFRIMSSALDE